MAVNSEQGFGRCRRIELLDFLRGLSIIYVMFYHLCYDLAALKGVSVLYYGTAEFELVHRFFLALLILISGICSNFSRDSVRRGAVLFFMGSALTIVSDLFFHKLVVVFGALSFFGVMMMLSGLLKPVLKKIDWRILLAVCSLLYVVTVDFADENGLLHFGFADYRLPLPENTQYSYPIGILGKGFFSADYFPLIPSGFLYLAGTALSKPISDRSFPKLFYANTRPRFINFIGRYSLWFYAAHQPLFLFLLLMI